MVYNEEETPLLHNYESCSNQRRRGSSSNSSVETLHAAEGEENDTMTPIKQGTHSHLYQLFANNIDSFSTSLLLENKSSVARDHLGKCTLTKLLFSDTNYL